VLTQLLLALSNSFHSDQLTLAPMIDRAKTKINPYEQKRDAALRQKKD
jgi:hypothetical protein